MRAVELEEKSITDISKIFQVCRATIYLWKSLKKETGSINSKSGYRLKISTVHTNSAKLKYSTNYGLTWKSVPLGIKGAYEPRFFYSIKLSDSDSVRFITNLFELYLNDYYSLEFYINTEKLELKNSIEVYRAEQLTKLTKSSIT